MYHVFYLFQFIEDTSNTLEFVQKISERYISTFEAKLLKKNQNNMIKSPVLYD